MTAPTKEGLERPVIIYGFACDLGTSQGTRAAKVDQPCRTNSTPCSRPSDQITLHRLWISSAGTLSTNSSGISMPGSTSMSAPNSLWFQTKHSLGLEELPMVKVPIRNPFKRINRLRSASIAHLQAELRTSLGMSAQVRQWARLYKYLRVRQSLGQGFCLVDHASLAFAEFLPSGFFVGRGLPVMDKQLIPSARSEDSHHNPPPGIFAQVRRSHCVPLCALEAVAALEMEPALRDPCFKIGWMAGGHPSFSAPTATPQERGEA